MSTRDELAEEVFNGLAAGQQLGETDVNVIAHAIAMGLNAKGWSKPHTVDSAAGLEALPHGSVIRDDDGDVYELWSRSDEPREWMTTGADWAQPPRLPVTVLFTPGGTS